MKDIKFRGLDKKGSWRYGNLITPNNSCSGGTLIFFENIFYGVKPETVGQYIGLLDRNGKMIYEGDILCGSAGAFIRYDEDGARFVIDVFGKINEIHFMDILQENLEVIGNVHEDSKGGEERQCATT